MDAIEHVLAQLRKEQQQKAGGRVVEVAQATDPFAPAVPNPGRLVAMFESVERAGSILDAAIFAGDCVAAELADLGTSSGDTEAGNYGLVVAELERVRETLTRVLAATHHDYLRAKRMAR